MLFFLACLGIYITHKNIPFYPRISKGFIKIERKEPSPRSVLENRTKGTVPAFDFLPRNPVEWDFVLWYADAEDR